MKKLQFIIILSLITLVAFAQKEKLKPTQSFVVSGEVKSAVTFAFADIKKQQSVEIGDMVITNHVGEKKSDSKKLKGVLLRDLLQTVEIAAASPKLLSEYYFVCKANDGYMVVYSWNELFNTSVGDTAYIITEQEGKTIEQMDDSILMLSAKDYKTGRRQLKSLQTIEVKRAN